MGSIRRCAIGFALLLLGAAGAMAQAPRVDAVSPAQGPIAGGTLVTLTGAGFTPDTTVRFNRTPAGVQFVDSGHLRVTTPPLGNGPFATALAAVRVSNASGTTYSEFLYLPPTFDEIRIGDITTIAGVGNFVGEGRIATQAPINAQAFAFDGAGTLYLGEETGGRIRKVGSDGRIVTIAGTGVIGYAGDGGPAIDAQFNWPGALAIDRSGNIYVADTFGNHRVRRIDAATGIVRTIAGTGRAGYSGDGGPAIQAELNTPYAGLAVDTQGNVYIAETGNQRVRRIDPAGVITTVAGNGTSGFSGDGGPATQAAFRFGLQVGTLAVDSRRNLYVVDFDNHRIRRISPDGRIDTVVGGGNREPSEGMPATQADTIFNSVAVDAQDRLLFTDDTHVWRLEADGLLARIVGTGQRALSPDGVRARDAAIIVGHIGISPRGDIHVSETVAARIRRIDATTGVLSTAAGMGPATVGESGSALAAAFPDIGNIALDHRGELLAVDPRGSSRIRRVDAAGRISTVAGIGIPAIRGFYHEGAAAATAGLSAFSVQTDANGIVYYNDFCSVRRIGADGTIRTVVGPLTSNQQCGFAGDGGPGTAALIAAEQATIKLDAQGNIFIADQFNQRVRRLDAATGIITTFAGSGPASAPGGYFPGGNNGFSGDGGPATQAVLNFPGDVALDSRRGVCISDYSNFRVRCVDAQGVIRTVAGGGNDYPGDGGPGTSAVINVGRLAFDRAGSLFIGDHFDGTIRKLDANGTLSTVAGVRRSRGFSGDGGPALQANIDYASGLVADASGNLLFFDGDNRRIRVIKQAATFGIGAPPVTPNPPGALSGLWWNPGESGWGISFTQRRNIVFAAWFTYDGAGNPKWYVASACRLPAATASGSCSDTLYEVTGPVFFGRPFDPGAVRVASAGTLNLTFTGPGSGSMTYTVAGHTRTVAITRQVFQSGTTLPAVDYTDLWWNAGESGWGIAITQQYGVMFLAWYVYDAAGRPVWYVATDCRVVAASNGCTGQLYRTTGPAFGPSFNASQVQVFGAGTVSVTFSDANNGVLSYTVNGVSASKAITRQLF